MNLCIKFKLIKDYLRISTKHSKQTLWEEREVRAVIEYLPNEFIRERLNQIIGAEQYTLKARLKEFVNNI